MKFHTSFTYIDATKMPKVGINSVIPSFFNKVE